MAPQTFLLLSSLLIFSSAWAKLDVVVESPAVSAKPGDKVLLKCALQNFPKPLDLKDFMVTWYTGGKPVAEFDDKITINKPGLSMSLEAIKNGDGTLTIESFTPENAGKYRCYVFYKSDSRVEQIVLTDQTKPKEEDDPLTTCETILDKKLDKAILLLEKVNTRFDELKKCQK